MTTGKPQPMAADSNTSDDLIAELSKLMAQDAQGSRQDAKPSAAAAPDVAARAEPVAPPPVTAQVTPFAVRIPGVPSTLVEPVAAAPVPRFDFSRPAEPVATMPRQEPSFAPAPAAAGTEEDSPFDFNFDFSQPAAPQAASQPAAAATHVVADEHDAIADLIAAELLGDMKAVSAVRTVAPAAPQVERVVAEAPPAAPVAIASVPVEAAAPAPAPEPVKANVPPKVASWTPTAVAPALADRPAQARPTLRPVNLKPIQKTEPAASDSFRIPPVFGLTTTPPPAANVVPPAVVPAPEPVVPEPVVPQSVAAQPVVPPKPRAEHGYLQPVPSEPPMAPPANDIDANRDPIDDIESLIGRAVRVEIDRAEEQPVARPAVAAPPVRSLATPTVPQPVRQPVSGVDEAIMAAAAATGAEVGWVSHDDDRAGAAADEPRRRRERAPRRTGMVRSVAGPLIAVALLLAAGFGLYSVLGLGGSDGPAPVLVADTAPIKQVPVAKSPVEQLQQSVVFNEMDGVVPGAEEQLVSRDQADVNEVTAIPPAATAVTDEGLANRKVRTVTVRPDGSIVSGEDSVAGAAILPVDRPNVPAVPGATAPSSALLASANATPATPAPEPVAVTPEPAPVAAAPVAPLVPGTEIAVVDPAGAPVAGKTAPVPYTRPASVGDAPARGPVTAIVNAPQASLAAPAATPTQNLAAAQQPAQAAAAIPAATNTAAAYAQLSSQRSPEVAQQVAKDLSARYASLLGGAQLEIVRADLGSRGTYYRVRVPAASQASAAQFCASVVASGGECLAM